METVKYVDKDWVEKQFENYHERLMNYLNEKIPNFKVDKINKELLIDFNDDNNYEKIVTSK